MISRFNAVLWASVIILCVMLYSIKYDALEAERRASALAREVAKERQTLRLLQAEWALRAEPQRLERLAKRHLNLQPVRAEQIATLDGLPLPEVLEPLYAQGRGDRRNRHAATTAGEGEAVLTTLVPSAPHAPEPVPLPQPRGSIGLQDVPGPVAVPVLPRKRPIMEGR